MAPHCRGRSYLKRLNCRLEQTNRRRNVTGYSCSGILVAFWQGGFVALFWRVWAAVMLVNFTVLSVFVALATLQFGSINSALVGERLGVLAERTVAPFEAAVRIGLPLSSVRNANALLERARQTDDSIVAIHVFDASGRIIHSTASPMPGEISVQAAQARATARGVPWNRETGDGFLSGINIAGQDGASAGGILIVYPGGGSVTRIRAMAAELELPALAVFLVSITLGAIVLRVGMRRQIRAFERIDAAVADFERSAWRVAAGGREAEAIADAAELRPLMDGAETRYRAVGRLLAQGDSG